MNSRKTIYKIIGQKTWLPLQKANIVFFILIFLCNNLVAQQVDIHMLGVPPYGNGDVQFMLPTKDTGFALIGINTADSAICSCPKAINPDTNLDYNYIIKKYDKNNLLQNKHCIKLPNRFWKNSSFPPNALQYLELCDDGNFIMGGIFDDTIGVLLKVDSFANIIWKQEYPGTHYGVGMVKRTKDNGFIFSTSNNYAGGLFDVHYGNWTTFDGLIVKTDSVGNIEFHKVYGSPADDGFLALPNLVGEDYLYVGGTNNLDPSYPDFICGGMPSYLQMWGVDKNFTVKWKKCYIDQKNQSAQYTTLYYLFDSTNSIILSWGGDSIVYNKRSTIGKYDSLGNIVWHKGYGPDSSTQPYNYIGGIALNGFDSSVAVSFSTHGFGGDVPDLSWISHDVYRSWNLFLDTLGSIKGQLSLGGNNYTFGFGILKRPTMNQFVLSGVSYANSGDFSNSHITVTNNSLDFYECYFGVLDYWPVNIPEIKDKTKKITIYPNPSSSSFTIILPSQNSKGILVTLRSISGQLIQQTKFGTFQNNIQINTNNLANGLYFVEVRQGNDLYFGKVVKE